jgi:hypothetical protein
MKYLLALTESYLAVALITTIGLSSYGCRDTVSVSEDVAVPLSSLTVTPGTLQPAFSSNTTNYTVDAPTAATSVTVTAVPKDITTTITINGIVSTQQSIPLGPPGSTKTISIVLSSQTGGETTYTVTVTRLLSSDNNLSALSVKVGTVTQPLAPTFASGILDYTVNVATDVGSVTISATKSDPNAVMSGSVTAGAGIATGQTTIQLDGPGTSKTASITLTAPNGNLKTYTVTIKRAASGNNNLSALSITPGPLVPAFVSSTLDYTVDVATDVTEVTVTATKADPNAVISGDLPNEGQATIQLDGPGTSRVISIIVIAQNGIGKTYTITVKRAAPSSDNTLSALTVTGAPLVPTFDPSITTYTVEVPFSVDHVTITATKSDLNAVMSGDVIAGGGVQTGQRDFDLPLAFGFTMTVSITVTAPNGVPKTYTIELKRPNIFPFP